MYICAAIWEGMVSYSKKIRIEQSRGRAKANQRGALKAGGGGWHHIIK